MKTAWSEKKRFVFLPAFRLNEQEQEEFEEIIIGFKEDPREETFYDLKAEMYKGFLIPQGMKINIPDMFENVVWAQVFRLEDDGRDIPHIKKIITKSGFVINITMNKNVFVEQIHVGQWDIMFPYYSEVTDEPDES